MSITSKNPRNFNFGVTCTPENVGPGIYTPNYTHQRYRARIPFGSTTRRELFNTAESNPNLGPGAYEPSKPRVSRSSLSSIGRSADRKYFVDNVNSPGPAAHSSLSDWNLGIRPVPKSRIAMENPENRVPFDQNPDDKVIPGPGEYEVKFSNKAKGTAFSQSKAPQRDPVVDDGIPGPGAYNTVEKPKQYTTPSPFFRNKGRRDIFNTRDKLDGYFLEHKAWRAVTPTKGPFGGRQKREVQFQINDAPGPGAYSIPDTMGNPKGPKRNDFGVDRAPYSTNTISNPGPGFYEDAPSKNKAIAIPRASRGELWTINPAPGPGQYSTDTGEAIAAREKRRIANPAFKDKEVRDSLTNKQVNPGPAAYSVRSKADSGVLGFSRAQRFPDSAYVGRAPLGGGPGPAAYVQAEENRVHVSRGGAPRFAEKKTTGPGPDAYNLGRSFVKPSLNAKLGEREGSRAPQTTEQRFAERMETLSTLHGTQLY